LRDDGRDGEADVCRFGVFPTLLSPPLPSPLLLFLLSDDDEAVPISPSSSSPMLFHASKTRASVSLGRTGCPLAIPPSSASATQLLSNFVPNNEPSDRERNSHVSPWEYGCNIAMICARFNM
jgi:hypothetical protein